MQLIFSGRISKFAIYWMLLIIMLKIETEIRRTRKTNVKVDNMNIHFDFDKTCWNNIIY